jgi:hypothetical protein
VSGARRHGDDPAAAIVARELLGQELQRHRLAQLEVVGPVDLAHAAAADQAGDPVAACNDGAGRQPSRFE